MRWTIDEAIELLRRGFPSYAVIVADGGTDYLVGTIEDEQDEIVGSFMLNVDASHTSVSQIHISEGQKYCGVATPQDHRHSIARHAVPIQITRQNEEGSIWGMVGDYEVCVSAQSVFQI